MSNTKTFGLFLELLGVLCLSFTLFKERDTVNVGGCIVISAISEGNHTVFRGNGIPELSVHNRYSLDNKTWLLTDWATEHIVPAVKEHNSIIEARDYICRVNNDTEDNVTMVSEFLKLLGLDVEYSVEANARNMWAFEHKGITHCVVLKGNHIRFFPRDRSAKLFKMDATHPVNMLRFIEDGLGR